MVVVSMCLGFQLRVPGFHGKPSKINAQLVDSSRRINVSLACQKIPARQGAVQTWLA